MAQTGVISIIHEYGGSVTCNAEWYKSARARRSSSALSCLVDTSVLAD
jgi:hypothetical protein